MRAQLDVVQVSINKYFILKLLNITFYIILYFDKNRRIYLKKKKTKKAVKLFLSVSNRLTEMPQCIPLGSVEIM